jgi:tRNA (guanine37-N1)-methyltransferase
MIPKFLIITTNSGVYPEIFGCPLILKALENKIWDLEIINLYDFGIGKHKKIDDKPFGGGSGLLISAEVLGSALNFIERKYPKDQFQIKYYCTDPSGRIFDQNLSEDISRFSNLEKNNIVCFFCPRFEGVDARIFKYFEKISIGKFVVTNGDIVISLILNSILRLVPGVIGSIESTEVESFSIQDQSESFIEFDQFTKPREWRGLHVPEVLLSGNHKEIDKWRRENSLKKTFEFKKNNQNC